MPLHTNVNLDVGSDISQHKLTLEVDKQIAKLSVESTVISVAL